MLRYSPPGIGFFDKRYLKLDASNDPVTGALAINAVTAITGPADGGLTNYDLKVGDTNGTPTYGMIQIGNAVIGRTSYNVANIDLDGAILYRNMGGPVTGQIEHIFTEATGNTCRFALPSSGVGNATYNPRSMLLAGPAPVDTDFVTVGYWQTNENIFDNLVCDTVGDGADLGVQNDLEVEGDIFADSLKESTTNAGITLSSGNVIFNDTIKVLFGTGKDASILYNNTDLVIDPNEVGTGKVLIEPTNNATSIFQVNNAAGAVIFNVDSTNKRGGVGTATPVSLFEIADSSINMDGGMTLGVGITAKSSFQALNVSGDILTFFGSNAFADGSLAAQRFDTSKLAWFFAFDNRPAQDLFKLERLNASGVVNRPFMVLNDGSFGFGDFSSIPAFTGAKFYQDADGDIFIGSGVVGKDYKITFKGETNEGILTWMEDEDHFKFGDDVVINDTQQTNAGIFQIGGGWTFKESSAPTADLGYGKLWTESNNELFFQSGDGNNHLLHGDAFSEIWFHNASTVEVSISTQAAFTIIDSFTVVGHEDDLANVVGSNATNDLTLSAIGGGEYEVSYHMSMTATGGADKEMVLALGITLATPKDITNVTDDTITPIVITSTAHGLENGDMVEIVGVLGNTAANGSFIVDSKTNNTFEIVALDGTATVGSGDFDEGSPTGDVTIEYPGNMVVHREVRGASLGALSATGLHILADDDVLAIYVANLDGTTNLTVAAISFDAFRIGD